MRNKKIQGKNNNNNNNKRTSKEECGETRAKRQRKKLMKGNYSEVEAKQRQE